MPRSMDRSANPCVEMVINYLFAVIKDGATFGVRLLWRSRATACPIHTLIGDSIFPDDSANTLTITLARPAGYFLAVLASCGFRAGA